MDAKLSIIVIAHNQESFLNDSLKSIEQQSIGLHNIELILVNDSSTDKTASIFKQFQNKFPQNTQFITVNNRNVGKTRNMGLKLASSKYVLFVDGDDILARQSCEILMDTANNRDKCIVISYPKRFQKPEEIIFDIKKDQLYIKTLNKLLLIDMLLEHNQYMGHGAGVLFSRSLFESIQYPDFTCYEDLYIAPDLIKSAKNIYEISTPFYNYRQTNESTSSTLNNEKASYMLKCLEKLKNFILSGTQQRHYNALCIKQCRILIDNTPHLNQENKNTIADILSHIPILPYLLSPFNRTSRKRLLLKNKKDIKSWFNH